MTARERTSARRSLRAAVVTVALALITWYVVRSLGAQWDAYRLAVSTLSPRWALVGAATAVVVATYALLIASWRTLVTGWGGHLAYWQGVRIWTVSNLARYIPGALWSVGAMGMMAGDAGVPPATAAGAAILNMVLNLAAGLVVLTAASGDLVGHVAPGLPHPQLAGAALAVAGVLLLPICVPALTNVSARLLRRDPPPPLPLRALGAAFGANVAAWCTYGLAFGVFAHALRPSSGANWAAYVAVYAFSYLTGFLVLLAPAGLFVRETAMIFALTHTGLASPADAFVLAAASRLWLTALEVAPGVAFVATGALRSAASRGNARA